MKLRVYGSLGATTFTTRLRWNARPMSDPPSNTKIEGFGTVVSEKVSTLSVLLVIPMTETPETLRFLSTKGSRSTSSQIHPELDPPLA